MTRLITRLLDRSYEVQPPGAGLCAPKPFPQTPEGVTEWQRAVSAGASTQETIVSKTGSIQVQIRLRVEGIQEGAMRTWTPSIESAMTRTSIGVGDPLSIPNEFARDGAEGGKCARAIADDAADALCERYLEVQRYKPVEPQ
jgi:hypothetical protein